LQEELGAECFADDGTHPEIYIIGCARRNPSGNAFGRRGSAGRVHQGHTKYLREPTGAPSVVLVSVQGSGDVWVIAPIPTLQGLWLDYNDNGATTWRTVTALSQGVPMPTRGEDCIVPTPP
jgi:hypothetical protein